LSGKGQGTPELLNDPIQNVVIRERMEFSDALSPDDAMRKPIPGGAKQGGPSQQSLRPGGGQPAETRQGKDAPLGNERLLRDEVTRTVSLEMTVSSGFLMPSGDRA